MNHVYRLKRSGRSQQLQPVPETARAAGKGSRTGKTLAQAVTATLASVALGGMASLAHAQQAPPVNNPPAVNQLPQGGVVTRGSAHIVSSTSGNTALMSVNQSSQRAVIDWSSFNVGSQAKVQFNQPSSSAVVLNNILGHNASQIYGQISANGQVFLSNPNGVYFSPTAQVNVGGLVATTGKVSADEFMAGKVTFNRDGSNGRVVNEGQLQAALGGYIALLAPEVRNQGVVIAQAGTVALASGEAITLNFNNLGTGLAGITTTPQAIAALVENRSAVLAEGGQIILSAHALATLQGSVIKNSGQLSATGLIEMGGKIVLMGGSIELTGTSQITANGPQGGGTVLVGGDWQGQGDMRQAVQVTMAQGASIEANATQQGDGGKVVLWSDVHNASSVTQVYGRIEAKGAGMGVGGRVETSGHTLKVGDATRVNTTSPHGPTGHWLIDPTDFTVAAVGGDMTGTQLGNLLGSNSITLQAGAGTDTATTYFGAVGGTAGNILINDTISWSANTLTLNAQNNVTINKAMTLTDTAGLSVQYGQQSATAVSNNALFTVNAPINIASTGSFATKLGSGTGSVSTNYTIVNSLGAAADATTAPANPTLQGMARTALAANAFVLGSDIDASGTSTWNSNAGFTPIGNNTTAFSGKFNGLGHTITGLTLSASTTDYLGLFGKTTGSITNITLSGSNVTGRSYVGALAGHGADFYNIRVLGGTVTGTSSVGGMAGYAGAAVDTVNTSAAVTGQNSATSAAQYVGGLLGGAAGAVNNVTSSGNVTVSNVNAALVTGASVAMSVHSVGGLVGQLVPAATMTLSNNINTGNVTVTTAAATCSAVAYCISNVGGLIGTLGGNANNASANWRVTISNSSTSGSVSVASTTTASMSLNTTNVGNATGGVIGRVDYSGRAGLSFAGSLTLNNLSATGDVSGYSAVGGLVGKSYLVSALAGTNSFDNLWATGNITGFGHTTANILSSGSTTIAYSGVGGLFGANSGSNPGQISNSYYAGAILSRGGSFIGGLAGTNTGLIVNSYATGSISVPSTPFPSTSGISFIGGLVGYLGGGTTAAGISGGSYSNVPITLGQSITQKVGALYIGGLVGYWASGGVNDAISGAYALGNIQAYLSGGYHFGGLLGSTGSGTSLTGTASIANSTLTVTGNMVNTSNVAINSLAVGSLVTGVGILPGTYITALGTGTGGAGTYVLSQAQATGASIAIAAVTSNFINNSYAIGNVSAAGASQVGGLAGSTYAPIYSSYAQGNVTAYASAGGLVGTAGSTLVSTYALGNVAASNTGQSLAGGLVGSMSGKAIAFSYGSGQRVSGGNAVGGLVGQSNSATIYKSYSTGAGQVTATSSSSGGLMGAGTGDIIDSYSTLPVTSIDTATGGLVGSFGSSTSMPKISGSWATGAVSGVSQVGGLIGVSYGTITSSYASGAVTSTGVGSGLAGGVGGLIGNNAGGASVSDSFATGTVTATASSGISYAGGLIGLNLSTGSVNNSYASGLVTVAGPAAAGGLMGYTAIPVATTTTNNNAVTRAHDNTTTLTMSNGSSASGVIALGTLVSYSGSVPGVVIPDGTTVIAFGTGDGARGGQGTYTLSNAITVPANSNTVVLSFSNSTTSSSASISGNTLTLGGTVRGYFSPGTTISGDGIPAGTYITGVTSAVAPLANGFGGSGSTYTLNNSATVSNATVTGTNVALATYAKVTSGVMALTAVTGGFAVGMTVTGPNIPANTTITGFNGSGFTLSNSFTTGVTAITGQLVSPNISNVYATGSVVSQTAYSSSSYSYLGGLIGQVASTVAASIANGYASGAVPLTAKVTAAVTNNTNVALAAPNAGSGLVVGSVVSGTGVPEGTTIAAFVSGTSGAAGTYRLSNAVTLAVNSYLSINSSTPGTAVRGGVIGYVGVGNLSGTSMGAALTPALSNLYFNSSANSGYYGVGNDSRGVTTLSTGVTGLSSSDLRSGGMSGGADRMPGLNFSTSTLGAAASGRAAAGNYWILVDDDGTFNNASGAGASYPMLASEYSLKVTSAHQLQLMGLNPAANYAVQNSISFGSSDVWTSSGFVPVGTGAAPFTGSFMGSSLLSGSQAICPAYSGGCTISGLTINSTQNSPVGLFGTVGLGGTLTGVRLLNASVVGAGSVGAVVGSNAGTLSFSSSTGSVSSSDSTGTGYGVGGIAGVNTGSLDRVFSTATVTGTAGAAMLAGGVIGDNQSSGTLSNAYASGLGNISASGYAGGLAGANSGAISNSYAAAPVAGLATVSGGLVGNNANGSLSNSFWDTAVTGQSAPVASNPAAGTRTDNAGMSTANMKTLANYNSATSANGNHDPVWNFTTVWNPPVSGTLYPALRDFLIPMTVTANPITKVYDGLAYLGTVSVRYSLPNVSLSGTVAYDSSVTGYANVGSYTVMPTGLYSNQYNVSFASGPLTISKRPLTFTASSTPKVYDGTTAMDPANLSINNLVAGQTLSITSVNAVSSQVSANASNYINSITLGNATDGSGGLIANYSAPSTLSRANAPVALTAKSLTVSGLSAVDKTYDGTVAATLSGVGALTGVIAADIGLVSTSAQGTFASPNAAAGIAVTPVLSGLASTNYALTQPTGLSAEILAKSVTVTNTSRSTTYDGVSSYGSLANGTSFTTTGLVGSDAVASLTQRANASGVTLTGVAQAGSFTVTPSASVMGVGLVSNYSFSYVDSTHTVDPSTLTITPINGSLQGTVSKLYDGKNTATLASSNYLLTGWAAGEGGTVTKTIGTYDSPDAATGKTVTVSLGSSDYLAAGTTNLANYTLPTSISGAVGEIMRKPVTVTGSTAVNKVYDGTLAAVISGGSPQGILLADSSTVTLNGTGTFASKNVSNSIAVTSTSTLSGTASGNYILTQPTGLSANITRLNSVTWTGGATGDWLNPANWEGGAVPDKSNVATVVIPTGTTVSFNNIVTGTAEAGSVNVDGITGSSGSLTVSAGTLAVGTTGVTLSNLIQTTGSSFSTQGPMSLGSGSLAVSTANYSLGAVSTSGAFSVTNSGGDVTLSGNVTGGNSALLIKSTGNIIQNASTAVSTTGGNITYWADSDASGAGYIALNSGTSAATKASVSAGAGNIVFGGGNGATAADGAATGVKGIALGKHASLSGANITLVGRGSASTVGSFTSGTVGVEVADYASVVGTGAVAITGTGGGGSAASASSSNIGVQIGVLSGAATVESSGNSVAIAGAGGGTGNASLNNFGVFLTGMNGTSSTVRTAAGDLTIRGTEGAGTTTTGYNRNSGIYVHGDVQLGGTSQTGALNLLANDVLWPMMATAKMQTTGAVTIAPISTSFVTEQRMGTNVLLAGTPASLTMGKVGNTAALNLLTPMSVAGPISLMGGPISLNANLTSTGLISLKSYGGTAGIQQGLPGLGTPWGIITAPLVSVTAANNPVILGNNNAIGTVAVTGASNARIVNAGALTIGTVCTDGTVCAVGTAGRVSGISASGTVVAITNTGDLTIADHVATTSTSAYVMNLEAGFNANPGDSTGGNILLTNSSTITTGVNATARLYTGSLSGSTALAAYVGAGTGRFRYGSDGTTSNFTQAVTSGLNLIYREKPTVSWSSEADQSIVYGQSMTYSTTGSLNTYNTTNSYALGLQNGDDAKVSQALLVRTSVAPKTTAILNSSNVYDAGVYEVSKTASAEALGYAATNPKITVTKAPLTITAKDASKVYDGGAYSLGNGLTYSGFVAGEGSSALGGAEVYGGTAQGAINAGTYALTVSGLTATNYRITYNPGTLTVSPKALTIRVNDDARFVGQSDTAGYAGASYTGFVTGESIATLGSLSITRTPTSAAGTYMGALQASIAGLTNTNYAITYMPGNYTIVPADQLLVKFSNVSTPYGTDPVYAVTSAQYLKSDTNLVVDLTSRSTIAGTTFSLTDGDGGSTSFSVGAQSASLSSAGKLNAFGGYQLGASSVNNSSTNYNNTITTTGALTVHPKTVSATSATGLTKTYDGNANMPSLSLALSGTLSGDNVSVTGQGAYASANVGTTYYDVKNLVLSGVDQGNYVLTAGNSISGTNGTINKAALTVTAQGDRKIFDGEVYVGGKGVAYSGLVNNEDSAVLGGALSYTGTSQNAVNAGSYTITPQGLSSSNYTITYVDAPLTIDPATITTSSVNAMLQGPITKVYDGNDAATLSSSNYILTGWVGTDTADVTKVSGTYDNPNVGNGKLVIVNNLITGDYQAGTGTNLANYVLPTSISGTVGSIKPKSLTVSGLTAANKTYDGNASVLISNWGSVSTGVANESLTLLSGTAAFADANAQNNKMVTASGYSLADGTGGLASNYVLSSAVTTTGANIEAKAVTVSATARTTPYDAVSTYSDLANNTGFVTSGLMPDHWVSSVSKSLGGSGVSPTGLAQAGSYTVSPSSAVLGSGSASNYTFNYAAASNTVDKANLAVTATPSLSGNVYRGTAYTGSYSSTALGNDANAITVTGMATGTNAGTYSSSLAVSGAVLSNYNNPVITDANLVISPRPVAVSNTSRSTSYDAVTSYGSLASGTTVSATNASTAPSGTGLVGADALGSVTQTASGTGVTASGVAQAGSFTVTPSAAVLSAGLASNYDFSYVDGTHTVDKANLALNATASLTGNVYRGTAYMGTYTTTALGSDTSGFSVTGMATGTNAGTYTSSLAVSGAVLSNYNTPVITNADVVISPKPVTVTNTARSTTYDGTISYATLASGTQFTTSALVGPDAVGSVTQTANGVTSTGVAQAGSFSVTPSAAVLGTGTVSNYSFSYVDGTHTVDKANATVMANSGTLTYNGGHQTVSGFTASGLVGGETASVLTGVTASRTEKNAGTYATTASGTDGNYNLAFVDGSMVINKAAITATGNSASVIYNGANQTVNGFTLSGLQGSDTVGSLTSVLASGATAQNAGSYTNTVTAGVETNYTVTPVNGSLTIARAALTATGKSAQVTYKGANQSVNGFTVSGLMGNDTEAGLTGISASGVTGFNVGSYANTMTVVDQPNYTVTGVNGSLLISAAPITVIEGALKDAVSKVYDSTTAATLSSSHYLLTGWLGSDMATVTKTAGTFDTANAGSGKTVTVRLNRSDYQANGSTNLLNYELPERIQGAVGQITKASVIPTITASDKVYDTTTVANGAVSLSGVYSADALAASAVAAGYSFSNANVGAGKTVTATGIALGSGLTDNYVLTSHTATGTASITPAPVTVTAKNAAKFVTQNDTANFLGYAVMGLLGSETPASAGITAGVSLSRSNDSVHLADVYPGVLVPSGAAVIGNYAVRYVPGTFTIVPAGQLLVETISTNTTYGTSSFNPIASVAYLDGSNNTINPLTLGSQAVVNGATVFTYNDGASGTASFSIAPTGTTTSASGQLRVGSYGLVAGHFSKTTGNLQSNTATVTGNLTVQPLAITVAATPSTTTYNSTTQAQAQSSGVLGGDAVTVSGAVRQRNAGSYTSALSATGADVGNYSITYGNSNFTINPAVLTTLASAADKVYDGSTSAGLTLTDNRFSGDAVSVTARGQFADKNVGANKSVAITGLDLSGADASNYSLNAPASTTAAITRLAQVTWVGGTTGSWFDPANWAGGAVPDLANVANVTIPSGVTVSFDHVAVSPAQAGAVNVDSLGTAGSLALSAGSLNVGSGGVALNTLTQTGGILVTTGALALGSLSQSAGSLSADSLSTTTAFNQSGTGTMAVAGNAGIAATAAPVVLGNLSTGGSLNVSSTGGSISQTAGTVLAVTGPLTLTASQGGAAADVTLDNAGNALNGPVTATGADVKLRTTGALATSVTATGNVTLTSGDSTTLGATMVGGDLRVTTANADVTQTGPLVVGGTTTLNAGTGSVQLTDAGNRLVGTVKVTSTSSAIVGAVSSARDQAPAVLTPKVGQAKLPYQVTLVQLPQKGEAGQVHVELQNAAADAQIALPVALQNWIAAAGPALELDGLNASQIEDIKVIDNGATLSLRASLRQPMPLEFVIRAGREQVKVRIVWKP